MIRVNPHLSRIDPHCTYDEAPGMPWDAENELSPENLRKLEARIEELEGQVRSGAEAPSFTVLPQLQPCYLPVDFLGQTANSSPEFTSTPRSS
ncbi:hypothetical protein FS749_008619, partial [Ceratobasidium sp. UAMH 11750]